MNKMVTVLLSLYRPDPNFLKQQLLSLAAQDYAKMEVLIWDDCPGEDLAAEIEENLPGKPYTYMKCAENLGYIRAFEYLTRISTGDYVAFCDQDDIWEPQKISRCIQELEAQDAVFATSDRMIIDEHETVLIPSFRAESKAPRERWKTGDDISLPAVFSCYGLGMTIVVQGDAVRQMVPFSAHTGHDKWVTMCAAAMGKTIYIEEVLQRYRRHGKNESGVFAHLHSKQEYYAERVDAAYALAREFLQRFPDHPHKDAIRTYAIARKKRKIRYMLKYRQIEPQVTLFECCLKFMPNWLFQVALKILGGRT